ncbi:hypothetical protein ASPSYDRAFT_418538 [Aspergillus sydowii CBS 593.65]|uniref:Transmembrane protein n=1 Tax=Aspergillus sydowii CBS 593.65 TaxID=1036612 RepID=A0A1L9T8K6_9EURO|nr:uncharacterized protein ASPSYDRAFT_418538 [Aspergillus sydowii CBS 593.65]OJJ55623.1 hypothetical protein ASPSYDRAFT_418538 [Aspergillus sydowii CBS 593.65]
MRAKKRQTSSLISSRHMGESSPRSPPCAISLGRWRLSRHRLSFCRLCLPDSASSIERLGPEWHLDLILLLVAFAVNLVCLLACCLLRSLRARVVVEEQIDIICPASGQARTAHAKNAKNASNGQRCTKQVIAVLSLTRPATASFLTASIHNVQSFRSLSKRIR